MTPIAASNPLAMRQRIWSPRKSW